MSRHAGKLARDPRSYRCVRCETAVRQNGAVKLLRPWAMAVLTLVVLAAIAGLVVAAGLGRPRGGTRTVSVTGCDFVAHAMHGDIYRCGGGFTADNQSFTIPYVTFTNSGRLAPGHRV